MFTGIVEAVGRIDSVAAGIDAARLVVNAGKLALDDVAIGDSIAVSGCCLTVVGIELDPPRLAFDVSAATLACTAGLDVAGPVNLEKALRLSDRLGGHLMTGHVDGVATIVSSEVVSAGSQVDNGPLGAARLAPEGERAPWERPCGAHRRLVADAPAELARFIAKKGSIALAGVSLTVNDVAGIRFEVNLIPHTLDATTLGHLRSGSRVNMEIDLVARYVARLGSSD